MNKLLSIFFALLSALTYSQVHLTIENVDTVLNNVVGYDIPRKTPTKLIFRKNYLEKMTPEGFVLRCGDDNPVGNNNNLDGAVIQGNKLVAVPGGGTHGMMLGFNVDYDVRHNYVSGADYGLVIEGDTGMVYSSGGIAYNIIASNRTFGILLFGPDRVKIYNNTFFSNRQRSSNGILRIETNNQHGYDITTSGTEIKNNIFYSERDALMIAFDDVSVKTLTCDYNVYYCEAAYPVFRNTSYGINYNWYQWRALGFDEHSIVLNPRFKDKETFVPTVRMDFGTNLGIDYQYGLASTAEWVAGKYPDTIQQNTNWQVGAIILDSTEYTKKALLSQKPNWNAF
jgi:parallel beta-helix repeat protein